MNTIVSAEDKDLKRDYHIIIESPQKLLYLKSFGDYGTAQSVASNYVARKKIKNAKTTIAYSNTVC